MFILGFGPKVLKYGPLIVIEHFGGVGVIYNFRLFFLKNLRPFLFQPYCSFWTDRSADIFLL